LPLFHALRGLLSRDRRFSQRQKLSPRITTIPSTTTPQLNSIFLNMANKNPPVAISNDRISEAEDKAMDKEIPSTGHVEPGISIRMGPVDDMDVDEPATNGNANGKRKARSSITNGKTYKDDSSSDDDDKPLVRPT
jgi:hypothetical protein